MVGLEHQQKNAPKGLPSSTCYRRVRLINNLPTKLNFLHRVLIEVNSK